MASAALLSSSAAAAALLLLLSLLSIGADARPGVHFHPCKTLFISYTFTSSSSSSLSAAVNRLPIATSDPADSNTFHSVAVLRIIRPRPYYYASSFPAIRHHPIRTVDRPRESAVPTWPAFGVSSLQERAKDILFVVVGLLFGVGCGALTAATLYLAWSLVNNRYQMCGYDDAEEEEFESPKKMGYVKIAEPANAKEGYEGN